MHFNRDQHLRMGTRQLNWLRFEHFKRSVFFSVRWRTFVLVFLTREQSLYPRARVLARQHLTKLSKASRGTRHTTRC